MFDGDEEFDNSFPTWKQTEDAAGPYVVTTSQRIKMTVSENAMQLAMCRHRPAGVFQLTWQILDSPLTEEHHHLGLDEVSKRKPSLEKLGGN